MSIQDKAKAIRDLLHRIEAEMQRLGLWSTQPPTPEAFASTQPFCYDTMAFEQWLQWVFIARVRALLDQGGELSLRSQIAPLAEMIFEQMPDTDTSRLLALIAEFDALSSNDRAASSPR